MKYGEVVTLVRNGKEINALVLKDRGGKLSVVYLDPALEQFVGKGRDVTATAFDVPMLIDGATNGWKQKVQLRKLSADEQVEIKASFDAIDEKYTHTGVAEVPQVPATE